jgi:hypothetical protein
MNNDLELQRALRSFYRAKSLSSARLEYLIQAKTRALLPTRRWQAIHLMPITALGVACAVCLFLGVRQEQQRATERAVCAEVVMNYEKHSPIQVLSSQNTPMSKPL